MNIADVDKDGSISFNEFFFFVLVNQIPSTYIAKEFERAGGHMTVDQFTKIIEAGRKKTLFGQNLKLSRQQKDDYLDTCKQMVERIYNGRKSISLCEWMDFRNELQEMIWSYEFHQFELDYKHHMSAYDFAQSFYVYYLPFHKIDEYMEHLNQYDHYKVGCVSFKQFVAFQYFLKYKAKIILRVIENKQLDMAGLRELVSEFQEENNYCKDNDVEISDEMLEAFIHAMDLDGNGSLDGEEVLGIIYNRKTIGGQKMKNDKKKK